MGNIYFASDAHLGSLLIGDNSEREKKLVCWIKSIKKDAGALYLLGDMFDFWFEYKHCIPKGNIRFLSALCELTDNGIPVHYHTGNHDIWAFDYLRKECGVEIHRGDEVAEIYGKRFYLGHGDGLDPNDKGYLFLKKVFHNRFLQKCFRLIHPDIGIRFAHRWSGHSRVKPTGSIEAPPVTEEEKEAIAAFCKGKLEHEDIDYFIFGHRHQPIDMAISDKCRYINTGDWITHYSYAVFDGHKLNLKFYPQTSLDIS